MSSFFSFHICVAALCPSERPPPWSYWKLLVQPEGFTSRRISSEATDRDGAGEPISGPAAPPALQIKKKIVEDLHVTFKSYFISSAGRLNAAQPD